MHWTVWDIDPTIAEIGENLRDILSVDVEGITDFGEMGYGGPAPPDKRHTYVFKLYALDSELKNKIKSLGGSVMSLSNDKIVLES